MDLTSAPLAIGCWLPWAGGIGAGGPGALGGLPPRPPDPPDGPPLGGPLLGGPDHPPPGVEYWLRLALSLELMLAAVPVVVLAATLPVLVSPLAGPFPLELEPSPPP